MGVQDMQIFNPVKAILEKDAVKNHKSLMNFSGKCALIVTGRNSAKKTGALYDVLDVLKEHGKEWIIFDEVTENPGFDLITKGLDFLGSKKADAVIGIGGGSPLDASKAISVLHANRNSSFEDIYKNPNLEAVPVFAVPTTSGTGSEMTQYSVLTNKDNVKSGFTNFNTFPKVSFVDPKYTLDMPWNITLSTAVDAFSHSAEGYMCISADSYIKNIAENSMKAVKENLENIKNKDSLELRTGLSFGSMTAGYVISHTGTVLPHSLGYGLTSEYGIKHGLATFLFIIPVLKRLYDKNIKFDFVNNIFGSLKNMENYFDKLEINDYRVKISDEHIDLFSERVSKSGHVLKTPGNFTKKDIEELYLEVSL